MAVYSTKSDPGVISISHLQRSAVMPVLFGDSGSRIPHRRATSIPHDADAGDGTAATTIGTAYRTASRYSMEHPAVEGGRL
jgi:hypothetical protein